LGDVFGVGSFVTQRSADVAKPTISRAVGLGAGWVREELTATRLHASAHGRYHWRTFDAVVDRERAAHLSILGLLDYSNTWGYPDHGYMPHAAMVKQIADFASFAYAVARHYRGRIRYWQIWNEPDRAVFWKPAPNASDYAHLLTAAYRAVKRADRRDVVVMAGTTGVDLPYIHEVVHAGGRFDVLAVHPYRNLPEPALLSAIRALQGLHHPIWFTEIGWAAGPDCWLCTNETDQAAYLVRFFALAAAAGVQRIFWYDLRDDPSIVTSPEAHFGLVRRDLSAKPAYVSYADIARLLRGARFVRADALGAGGVYALRFSRDHETIEILWNTGPVTREISLEWSGRTATVMNDIAGQTRGTTAHLGRLAITLPVGSPLVVTTRRPLLALPSLGPLIHIVPTPAPTPMPLPTATPHATSTPRATPTPGGAWVVRPTSTARPFETATARESTIGFPPHATAPPKPTARPTRTPAPAPIATAVSTAPTPSD
jgi:hypothetical protein